MGIFTHVVVGANDVAASRKFYDAALAALGIQNLGPFGDNAFLYGKDSPEFLITKPANGQAACHANGGTIGFAVETPEQADAWHAAGVANGGTAIENPPGVRKGGAVEMYLAYLRDPDGNKICALKRMG